MKLTTCLSTLVQRIKESPAKLLIILIRGYQRFISPLFRPSCRFFPSCSQYALTAIKTHGVIRGSWYAVCRIGKCHPFHPGGVDFVPGHCPEHTQVAHHEQS